MKLIDHKALVAEIVKLGQKHGATAINETNQLVIDLATEAEQTVQKFSGSPVFEEMLLNTTVQTRQKLAAAFWDRNEQGQAAFWEALTVGLRFLAVVAV